MGLTFNIKALFTAQGILKVIQIILALICIGLLRQHHLNFGNYASILGDNTGYYDRQYTGVIAIGSSLLISIPLLVGYIFFDHSNHLLEALFCLTAAIMNATGGALAIELYHEKDSSSDGVKAGLAMGAMMIINALMYLIDCGTGGFYSTK